MARVELSTPVESIIRTAIDFVETCGAATDQRTVIISHEEHAAFELAWEKETGRCFKCGGEGTVNAGWSQATGERRATCPRCRGQKTPPNP